MKPGEKNYFPIINLLRGLAAMMVCFFHFSTSIFTSGELVADIGLLGRQGVYVFFVISGFVIPLSLYSNNYQPRNIFRYLFRRGLRIEIPYIASILLIIIYPYIYLWQLPAEFPNEWKRFLYHITYLIPFSNYDWFNIIYWTLAIEFQFYILTGIIFVLLLHKNKFVSYATIICFAASALLFTDTRFVFHYGAIFLQGILLFMIKIDKIKPVTGALLIVSCGIAAFFTHSLETAIFTLLTTACIGFLNYRHRISDWFGKISYSLYLTHGLVGGNIIANFLIVAVNDAHKALLLTTSICASVLFAFIFWRVIEEPSRKLSKKIKEN